MGAEAKLSVAKKAAATEFHAKSPFKVYFYLAALIMAYFAKYFCTSFLYIVQTLWAQDQNISSPQMSRLFILGYVMSMIGKFFAGRWSDTYGGRKVQMLSLIFYINLVILWSFGDRICEALGLVDHYPVFLMIWLANGFFALGLSWTAIVVCASNWIPPHLEGRLLAVVGCAPELGDTTARLVLSPVIKSGWGGLTLIGFGAAGNWQTVSLSAALVSIVLCLPMIFCVPESPLGYEEEKMAEKKQAGGAQLDSTLMALTCCMCGLLYAIRTMFLLDSVTWLSEVYCINYHPGVEFAICNMDSITVGNVARASLLFTFFGMFSVLLSGRCKDSLPKKYRGCILLVNSVILFITIFIMWFFNTELSFPVAVFLVGMIGFGDFGPYKTMSGAFAVDIGGKARKGEVTSWMGLCSNGAAAIILCVSGYVAGWQTMFKVLLHCSIGCIVCSLAIMHYDSITLTSARELTMEEPLLAA